MYYEEPTTSVTLAEGALRLETSPDNARASYFQEYDFLSIPEDLVIEADVRFVSGRSATSARSSAGIYFYPQKQVANWLWIGQDEIFVNAGSRFQRGAHANVDTDDAFHNYRIQLHGTAEGNEFDVYYDGALMLSGSLFLDDEDQEPEIAWGDLAYEASGISEWRSFRHTGLAVPEPASAGVVAWGILAFAATLVRRNSRNTASLGVEGSTRTMWA
jgi:hypothetical protein